MAFDAERIRNWPFAPIAQTYTERDTMLYALALGLGADPLDETRLRFVYEKNLLALPTMAGVLCYPGLWLADPRLGVDFARLVHGEQAMVFHRPLPPRGAVVGVNRVEAVVDKGAGRGALIVTRRTITDTESGQLLATLGHTAFARTDGGFSASGQRSDAAQAPRGAMPGTPAPLAVDCPTRPEAALIYRLCGDRTPLHADPAMARAAGFERPILHGMATFGIAGHAILQACCGWDPARLRSIAGRFSSPVFPGETIRVEIWPDAPSSFRFRARIAARDTVVLDHGHAEISA